MAGLHGISATVSSDSVHKPTWHPSRAAAQAASHPAWPAPTTITSKEDIRQKDCSRYVGYVRYDGYVGSLEVAIACQLLLGLKTKEAD